MQQNLENGYLKVNVKQYTKSSLKVSKPIDAFRVAKAFNMYKTYLELYYSLGSFLAHY